MFPEDLDFGKLESVAEEWTYHDNTSAHQIAERIAGMDVVLVNKVVLNRQAIEAAEHLKLICVSATGTNNVDLDAAAERGIPVCNVVGYATDSVAQHSIALMLGLATRWHTYFQDVRSGKWSQSRQFCLGSHPVVELAGKKIGVVGFGALGQKVAQIADALGMEVILAPSLSGRDHGDTPYTRLPMEKLLPQVDVLSIHCPLSEKSRDLIAAPELAQMKASAFIVNTARGGIVNEPDLIDALKNRRIAGAGFDVLESEPPSITNAMLDPLIPNLILTPHSAWVSREARQRLLDGVADNIAAFAQGQPTNKVNAA